MLNLVSLTRPTLQISGKTQTSNFWISGQSLIKVNFHNFSASDDIEMKLGAVTKLDRRNMPKNFSKNVMSTNDDVILFFASYG